MALSEISVPIRFLYSKSRASVKMVPDPQKGSKITQESGILAKFIIIKASLGGACR